ncbi:E3 ubiquitin-protein ligase RING1, partial [Quillaja saponaria]
ADVTYLQLHEADDDLHLSEQAILLDSIPYWSHHDFDLYSSDNEFSPCDHSVHLHIAGHEDDLPEQIESSIYMRGLDEFSDHDSVANADLLDRENQVNFVMNLFHQRVEQSQVMGDSNLVSEALTDSGFGVIDGNCDVGFDGLGLDLDLDLDLGLGFGVDKHSLDGDHNSGFMVENYGGGDEEDDFFLGRRVGGSDSGEVPSTVSRIQTFENSVRMVGFGSDSDEEDNEVLGVCVNSEDEYHVHEDNDDVASIPLCWDALQLEDHRDSNEDFEWEEVDGQVDEREVLSLFPAEDDRSVSPIVGPEEEVRLVRTAGFANLEWEVLLNANNLDTNLDLDHDGLQLQNLLFRIFLVWF